MSKTTQINRTQTGAANTVAHSPHTHTHASPSPENDGIGGLKIQHSLTQNGINTHTNNNKDKDNQNQQLGPPRVFRAVRHIGQQNEKFKFEVFVESVEVEVLTRNMNIITEWVRGPKKVRSNEIINLSPANMSSGHTEAMCLVATLFKSKIDPTKFASKESKIQFLEQPRRFREKLLGELTLDLSAFTHTKIASPERLRLPLQKLNSNLWLPNVKPYVTITLGCVSLGEDSSDFDDAVSSVSRSRACDASIPHRRSRDEISPHSASPETSPKQLLDGLTSSRIRDDDGGSCPPILLARISELEDKLRDKAVEIESVNEAYRREAKELRSTLEKERESMKVAIETHTQQLKDRDDDVSSLVKQLEELYEDLEKSQQALLLNQNNGDEHMEVANKAVQISNTHKQENENLKKRLEETQNTLETLRNTLREERSAYSKRVLDMSNEFEEATHTHAQNVASLERQNLTLRDTIVQLTQKYEEEQQRRVKAEEINQTLRRDMAEREDAGNAMCEKESNHTHTNTNTQMQEQLSYLQQEVDELTATRDALRRKIENDKSLHKQQIHILEMNATQAENNKNKLNAKMLSQEQHYMSRIEELEKEVEKLTEALEVKTYESVSEPHAAVPPKEFFDDSDGFGCDDKLNDRLDLLEKELVETKILLAQSETVKEEQIGANRNEIMQRYTKIITELESEIDNLNSKRQHRRASFSSVSQSVLKPLKLSGLRKSITRRKNYALPYTSHKKKDKTKHTDTKTEVHEDTHIHTNTHTHPHTHTHTHTHNESDGSKSSVEITPETTTSAH